MSQPISVPPSASQNSTDEGDAQIPTSVAEAAAEGANSYEGANSHSTSADTSTHKKARKKRFVVPSAFAILFMLTIVVAICTWVAPSGKYAKLSYEKTENSFILEQPEGSKEKLPATQDTLQKLSIDIKLEQFTSGALRKPLSVPNSYKTLDKNPASLWDIPVSMVQGTVEVADIMVFVYILGGLIALVRYTGAFEAGLGALTKKTKGHEFVFIFSVAVFMALGGSFCGLEEESIAFYPILCPIFISMGYDSIVCVGAIFLAGSIGTGFSTINPFSVVIASNAAGIPFTDGLPWRIFGLATATAFVIGYLWWYVKRIEKNPEASYTYEDREVFAKTWGVVHEEGYVLPKFTWRRKVTLSLFVAAFPIMVWGVMMFHWWFPTMAASFLTIVLIIFFLELTGPEAHTEKELTDAFTTGASHMVGVALVIGLARGISIIMNNGLISDSFLHFATQVVSGMPAPLFIVTLLFVFFLLGFIVPSTSGLAVLSMPIIAPLADAVGIPRWVIVCSYQWGQYAMQFLCPTGLVMATTQMLNLKYQHWLKFCMPVVIFMLVFCAIMLVAQVMLYGTAA